MDVTFDNIYRLVLKPRTHLSYSEESKTTSPIGSRLLPARMNLSESQAEM